jgi:ribosomal protein S18 acetylase RimI-like enzyme
MITLRPVTPEDTPFLFRVYASTRAAELALLGWDEAAKDSFLTLQFRAQNVYYQQQFPNADFQIVLLDGTPVGRLYVAHGPDEIHLIDIALLSDHRRQGIGRVLLEDILTTARQAALPVHLHVESHNPALRLYTRLGFQKTSEHGPYLAMEWDRRVSASM